VRGPVGIALRSTFNRVLFLSGLIRGRQQSQVNPYADGRFDWVSRHVAGAWGADHGTCLRTGIRGRGRKGADGVRTAGSGPSLS